ncbi:hypothetical protein BsWGS_18447 [Bradybaena similaris]
MPTRLGAPGCGGETEQGRLVAPVHTHTAFKTDGWTWQLFLGRPVVLIKAMSHNRLHAPVETLSWTHMMPVPLVVPTVCLRTGLTLTKQNCT